MTEQDWDEWIAEQCRTLTDLEMLAVLFLTCTEPAEA
jgi:hypothetical protein